MNGPDEVDLPVNPENASTPEKVRFIEAQVKPLPDAKQVQFHATLTPFIQPPRLEVVINTLSGECVSRATIAKVENPELDLTMDFPLEGRVESYILTARLNYSEFEWMDQVTKSIDIKRAPARLVRRVGAFLIDALVLGVIAALIGLIFSDLLIRLGAYARLIGALIALGYYSFFNSAKGKGKTPGKRLLHLTVLDSSGIYASFLHALLRSSILVVVFLFAFWSVPFLAAVPALVDGLRALLVYGLGGAICYLLLFNRKTGQSLHDLLAGTRVVYDRGELLEDYPVTPHRHKIAAMAVPIGLAIIIWGGGQILLKNGTASVAKSPALEKIMPLYQVLRQDQRFIEAGVSDTQQRNTAGKQVRLLVISVRPRDYLDETTRYQLSQELAALAPKYVSIAGFDALVVQVVRGFDMGLFARSIIWVYLPPNNMSQWVVQNNIIGITFSTTYSNKP